MSIQELLQFGGATVIVMIIAFVLRRYQSVGLPPGAARDDAGTSDGRTSTRQQQSSP